jgi:hypothetical protein
MCGDGLGVMGSSNGFDLHSSGLQESNLLASVATPSMALSLGGRQQSRRCVMTVGGIDNLSGGPVVRSGGACLTRP